MELEDVKWDIASKTTYQNELKKTINDINNLIFTYLYHFKALQIMVFQS